MPVVFDLALVMSETPTNPRNPSSEPLTLLGGGWTSHHGSRVCDNKFHAAHIRFHGRSNGNRILVILQEIAYLAGEVNWLLNIRETRDHQTTQQTGKSINR